LAEHLAAMQPEDRRALEVLSLFTEGATATALAALCERPADAIATAIERGVRGGLLVAGRDGLTRFVHELIREACASQCSPGMARRLHRAIADSVAGTPAEAHHRLAAEEATAASRVCFLREAARFEARRALSEASRYAEAALAVAAHEPGDIDDLPLRVATLRARTGKHQPAVELLQQHLAATSGLLRARYTHCLAFSYWLQGKREESLAHLRQASELFAAHGDTEVRSLVDGYSPFIVDLIEVLLTTGDAAAAAAECARALEAMRRDAPPAQRAALLLLAARAQRSAGSYDTAEATCRAAIEVLKPLGRGLELGKAYNELGNCSYYRRDFAEAERFYRMAIKVHTELGDLRGMANNFNNLGMALMRAERLEDAIVAYEQSLALKRRLGDRAGEGNSLNNLGNLWLRRHEPRRAFQCYRRGISLYRRLGRPRELATLYNNMGEESIVLGRLHRAQRALERGKQLAEGRAVYIAQAIAINLATLQLQLLDPRAAASTLAALLDQRSPMPANLAARAQALMALAQARAGEPAAAVEHEDTASRLLAPDLEAEARLDGLVHLAEAALELGRPEVASEGARTAHELALAGDRPYPLVRAERILAQVAALQGDWDRAEELLATALSRCESFGFRHELAQCYKLCGTLHWDIGLRARAVEDFQRCIETLTALDLRHELGLAYLELARRMPEEDSG
jgi:tetratricopeptide (TPR) repeat protein